MASFFRIACVCAMVLAPFFAPAAARAAEHLSLSADSVKFYGDRFLLEADGNVSLLLDHRYRLTGQTFSMDMRLNRFVIAGDVHVDGPDVALQGAGFADFFDSRRIYFVPLSDQPDRWTFEAMDFAHPFKGREMPGDPFFLPDITNARVTVSASRVEVEPMTYMRFQNAQVLNLGLMLPFPSYVINFSNNPDFRQNSLAGAITDAPYDFAGGSNTLSTLHLRYDQQNKAYASFEQHYSARGGWAVASINPITKPIKQYNVIGLGRMGPHDQAYGFFQAISYQLGFSAPLQLSAFGRFQFTHVLRQSYLQLNLNQNYFSLLAQPSTFDPAHGWYFGDFSHVWLPMHPFYGVLTWQGLDHNLGRTPLMFRMSSSFTWAHDNTYTDQYYSGLTSFLGQTFNSINNHTAEVLVYSKPVKVGPYTYLNFSFDKSRQWFSLPHHIDSELTNFSLSKTFGNKVAVYGGYRINNIGDDYGPNQSQIYPPVSTYVSPVDGKLYPGFAAFNGFATSRTLYGSAVFAPTPDFIFNLIVSQNRDFPEPIPGVLGNPPYQATGDLRFRISPHAMMDISRTYNFGWPGETWSPSFTIQVLP